MTDVQFYLVMGVPTLAALIGILTNVMLIRRLNATLDRLEARVGARLDGALSHRIDSLSGKMDTRFEKMDALFDRIDARFDKLEAKADALIAKLTELDRRFARIEAKLSIG